MERRKLRERNVRFNRGSDGSKEVCERLNGSTDGAASLVQRGAENYGQNNKRPKEPNCTEVRQQVSNVYMSYQ